jgi:hypothetical protein
MALKRQLMELKQEEMKTRMYINIAKPASLPELKRYKTRMYVNITKVK